MNEILQSRNLTNPLVTEIHTLERRIKDLESVLLSVYKYLTHVTQYRTRKSMVEELAIALEGKSYVNAAIEEKHTS